MNAHTTPDGTRGQAVIRPLQAADIPVVAAWIAQTPLWQRYGITAATAHANLARGLARDDLLLVADTPDAAACGLAWCLHDGMFGRSPYLKQLGVQPGITGFGVGTALLDAAEAACRAAADALFLLVSDFNHAAQHFYQRQGYRQIGALDAYVLPDVAELLYWKRL